jgi:hypothetical protein
MMRPYCDLCWKHECVLAFVFNGSSNHPWKLELITAEGYVSAGLMESMPILMVGARTSLCLGVHVRVGFNCVHCSQGRARGSYRKIEKRREAISRPSSLFDVTVVWGGFCPTQTEGFGELPSLSVWTWGQGSLQLLGRRSCSSASHHQMLLVPRRKHMTSYISISRSGAANHFICTLRRSM